MRLSKKSKRGIAAFNREKYSPNQAKYSAPAVWLYDDKTARFVEAYLKIKESDLDDSINSEDGEVAR